MGYLFIDLCRIEKGYPRPPDLDRRIPPRGCPGWRLATWILLGIAFGLGLIIGYVSSSQRSSCGSYLVVTSRRPVVFAYFEILICY
jgi:hypothetical protein